MARRPTALAGAAIAALVGALLLGACGSAERSELRPNAVDIVQEPADVTVPGLRLAFAAQRYRTQVFPSALSVTATYGSRPDLITGQPVTLQLDVYRPVGDSATSRPLLVWIHGGGFAGGNRGSMASESIAYARLGYVTASISYRLDPGNHCQQVQDGEFTDPTQLAAERARCEAAILAARDDAALAIAWLRANAATYGIDPSRIAVGGSSAGAITAIHVGQTLNTPGNPPPPNSRVSAVLAMSGCNYIEDSIDAFDAPIAMVASGGDAAVPYVCSVATVNAAEAVGTAVWRNLYLLENGHAEGLYFAHQGEIDRGWRLFLIDQLDLA